MFYNGRIDGVDKFTLKSAEEAAKLPTGAFGANMTMHPAPPTGSFAQTKEGEVWKFDGTSWAKDVVADSMTISGDITATGDITSEKTVKAKKVKATSKKGLSVPSSTDGSEKVMEFGIDDNGDLDASEEASAS